VAKAKVDSIESPEMLEINNKKIQVTAIGTHPQLGTLVGDQALIQSGVTKLKISLSKNQTMIRITGRQSAVSLKPTTAF
jgi:hypothetical protein